MQNEEIGLAEKPEAPVESSVLLDCDHQFGKYQIDYENMGPCDGITIGDGSVLMSAMKKDGDGFTGVSFLCGKGRGVGVAEDMPEDTILSDIGSDFVLRFNNGKSIDVLIDLLQCAKEYLETD